MAKHLMVADGHRRYKARRRIQRAFFVWLAANRHRITCPLIVERRTDRHIEISFGGVNKAITATLTWCIDIPVIWNDCCWDLLASFEACPTHVAEGYYCSLCLPGHQQLFPSREALWVAEIFEPFLEWVNEKLMAARFICLYDYNSMTQAKLTQVMPEPSGELKVVLEVAKI